MFFHSQENIRFHISFAVPCTRDRAQGFRPIPEGDYGTHDWRTDEYDIAGQKMELTQLSLRGEYPVEMKKISAEFPYMFITFFEHADIVRSRYIVMNARGQILSPARVYTGLGSMTTFVIDTNVLPAHRTAFVIRVNDNGSADIVKIDLLQHNNGRHEWCAPYRYGREEDRYHFLNVKKLQDFGRSHRFSDFFPMRNVYTTLTNTLPNLMLRTRAEHEAKKEREHLAEEARRQARTEELLGTNKPVSFQRNGSWITCSACGVANPLSDHATRMLARDPSHILTCRTCHKEGTIGHTEEDQPTPAEATTFSIADSKHIQCTSCNGYVRVEKSTMKMLKVGTSDDQTCTKCGRVGPMTTANTETCAS